MQDDLKPLSFATPDLALQHYEALSKSLQSRLDVSNTEMIDYMDSYQSLQEEVERELERADAVQAEMGKALEESKAGMESWKSKYGTSLREHTNTVTHMQRELESLRASEKALRVRLRDMELDNDDLEKAERAKDSSLMDFETRYGSALERIAQLEEDLVDKAIMAEEVQRLKDETKDQREELSVLSAKITKLQAIPRMPNCNGHRSYPTSTSTILDASTKELPSVSISNSSPIQELSNPRPTTPSARPRSIRSLLSGTTPATPPMLIPLTPSTKANIEMRSNSTSSAVEKMTHQLKALTGRIGARRNVAVSSGIPRASTSPTADNRKWNGNVLGMSVRGGSRPSSALGGEMGRNSERPGSRSALRRSISGTHPSTRNSISRTAIPARPSSRLSMLSTASTASALNSNGTGTFVNYARPTSSLGHHPSRSQTPTNLNPLSQSTNRRPWGSAAPVISAPAISSGGPTPIFDGRASTSNRSSTGIGLSASTRRRPSDSGIPIPSSPPTRMRTTSGDRRDPAPPGPERDEELSAFGRSTILSKSVLGRRVSGVGRRVI